MTYLEIDDCLLEYRWKRAEQIDKVMGLRAYEKDGWHVEFFEANGHEMIAFHLEGRTTIELHIMDIELDEEKDSLVYNTAFEKVTFRLK